MPKTTSKKKCILKRAVSELTLVDLVHGMLIMEFAGAWGRTALPEVYRRLGAKLSLSRGIIRSCLLVLSYESKIELQAMGTHPYIIIKGGAGIETRRID